MSILELDLNIRAYLYLAFTSSEKTDYCGPMGALGWGGGWGEGRGVTLVVKCIVTGFLFKADLAP